MARVMATSYDVHANALSNSESEATKPMAFHAPRLFSKFASEFFC